MLQDLIFTLESTLVREFRLSQSLLSLTREERQALTRGDVPRLLVLADHKETLLDRLAALAGTRRETLDRLAGLNHGDVAGLLDSEQRRSVDRLIEGTQVLACQVRELAQGNRLLASVALKQAASQQAGLLSDAHADLPALFTALLAARETSEPRGAEPAPPRPETRLLETMTALYRQQTAYRAVLKVSSRMLAFAG